MAVDIFINRISTAVSDVSASLEESAAAGRILSDAELLKEAGFARHFISSPQMTALELARRALNPIRDKIKNVDALILSNCLPENANVGDSAKFKSSKDVKFLMDFPASHLQSEFGLEKAFVVGLTQQACTGLLFAIRMARDLLVAESDVNEVLCVTSDRFPENALYEQAYNLICDGAAACVLSRNLAGESNFKYRAGHALTNGALAQASDDETVGTYFNYTHRVISETLAKAKMKMDDIRWVVPQNMNLKAWQILSRVLQIDEERIACPTLREVGHMISGDNLLNLKRLDEDRKIAKGDLLLMPMAGFGLNWHCLILEKV